MAKRSLGQNFLIDPNTQRRVVGSVDLTDVARIVEIGPGRGALTEGLLDLGLPIIAIEKDRALAAKWLRRSETQPLLTAVHEDALKVPIQRFGPPAETAVVGNIPYNVTTPLIFHLIERPRPREVVLMVQKEVADRLAAVAGTAAYGALTVGVQTVADVELLFAVPRTVFRPRPRVDSVVVRIRPHAPPRLSPDLEMHTRTLVRACFGWRRKQLGATLRKHPDLRVDPGKVPAVLGPIGVDPTVRAETLTPTQFVALAEALQPRP